MFQWVGVQIQIEAKEVLSEIVSFDSIALKQALLLELYNVLRPFIQVSKCLKFLLCFFDLCQ